MSNSLIIIQAHELEALLERMFERKLSQPNAPVAEASTHRLLTLSEACGYLRISRTTLYRLRREGKLKGHYAGRRIRFSQAELDAWLAGG
jgi:excisionase family DNA binding protein